jgi:hypothetical protein
VTLRERLANELDLLIAALPVYYREQESLYHQYIINPTTDRLGDYLEAFHQAASRRDLMEFIIKILEEEND